MEVKSAIDIVNALVYKPGWDISACDNTGRFEGTIKITVAYPARQSEREDAPAGYQHEIEGGAKASFAVVVADCADDVALYRRIIETVIAIEVHEAREFLRVRPTYWAPFHPHRVDGMKRWGTLESDLKFGLT